MKLSYISIAYLVCIMLSDVKIASAMNFFSSVVQKGYDNFTGHGVTILSEIDKNTFKCNLTNIQDLHRCEWGIQDLIAQNKTDDLVRLLKEFKKREILGKINTIPLDNANTHIVDAYQKSGEVEKIQAWANYCQLEKVSFDVVNATKAKNFIVQITSQELKNAYTDFQKNVLRMQELIKGIQTTQKLNANGPYPNFEDYKSMDTIYALMKREFEKKEQEAPLVIPKKDVVQNPEEKPEQKNN